MKRIIVLAASICACLSSVFAHIASPIITPSSVISSTSGSDVYPAGNLIDGSGLSEALSLENISSVTHDSISITNAWRTVNDAEEANYFSSLPEPTLTFTFAEPQDINGFAYWGYSFGSASFADNEAKTFSFSFFDQTGAQVGESFTHNTTIPIELNARLLPLPLMESVSSVELTITNNHFASTNASGDHVGLSEVRFFNRAPIVVTTLDDEYDGPDSLLSIDDISLSEAIFDAPAGSNILFSDLLDEGIITLMGFEQFVDRNLIIDASSLSGGLTIDANQRSRIMEIRPGNTVSLCGLTFTGGMAFENGGAILNNQASLSLIDCILMENSSFSSGGGIFNDSSDSSATLSLIRCNLTGNSANSGSGGGGGISNGGIEGGRAELSLTGCTFTGNSAAEGGGISIDGFSDSAELSLKGCTFTGNSADNGGGGISSNTFQGRIKLNLSDCTFTGNSADFVGGISSASFRGVAELSLTDCTFTGNSGSGISTNANDGSVALNLIDCTLTEHSGNSGISIFSNGPDASMMLNLSGCTLVGNSTTRGGSGGGIFSSSISNSSTKLNLINCILTENSADNGGGGIFSESFAGGSTELNLSGCTLMGNTAIFQGGGICSENSEGGSAELSLSGCTLSGNSATFNGGGIFSNGFFDGRVGVSLNGCTITGNSVLSEFGSGGGIYSESSEGGSAELSLNSCTLTGNSANDGEGGGAFCSNVRLSLNNTILAGNTARSSFGADLSEGGGVTTATGNNFLSSIEGSNFGIDFTVDPVGITIVSDPMLAPLGDYGGPTQTMPPLLGSPAIDAGGSVDPGGTDQRGLPRFVNEALDIGATEFQGDREELDLAFDEDIDGDGTSVGVELAIGTDPRVANDEDTKNLRIASFDTNGAPQFSFGLNNQEQPNIILRLMRSTDLVNFNEEVFNNETFIDDFGAGMFGAGDMLTAPTGGKAFYRLEAERR